MEGNFCHRACWDDIKKEADKILNPLDPNFKGAKKAGVSESVPPQGGVRIKMERPILGDFQLQYMYLKPICILLNNNGSH